MSVTLITDRGQSHVLHGQKTYLVNEHKMVEVPEDAERVLELQGFRRATPEELAAIAPQPEQAVEEEEQPAPNADAADAPEARKPTKKRR